MRYQYQQHMTNMPKLFYCTLLPGMLNGEGERRSIRYGDLHVVESYEYAIATKPAMEYPCHPNDEF
jgi:hypothetical protein